MSAIPAASVNLKTMADGTLRVSFDIEPAQAQDAFRLFAAPGTPVAIAALQVGYAAKSETEIPASEPKEPIGPLCKWLVMRCAEPEFWRWLEYVWTSSPVENESQAAAEIKQMLQIDSRKEVDTNPAAELAFHEEVRKPYQKWLVRRSA